MKANLRHLQSGVERRVGTWSGGGRRYIMLPRIAMGPELVTILQEAAMMIIPVVLVIGGILALVLYLDRTYPS